MTVHQLRDYQVSAVERTQSAWARGLRRVAVVMATGGGKTQVFCEAISRWADSPAGAGRRALVLAHRTELVEQAAARMRSVAPHLRVGIVKAERNDTLAPVVVASVATLASERRRAMLRDVGLIVVDECHHATAPTYRAVLRHFGALEQPDGSLTGDALALGVTATMSRADGTALGDVWQDVAYRRDIGELVRAGWLVRPRGIRIRVEDLDLTRVKQTRGDYAEGQLGEAIEGSMAPKKIAEAYREHAADRQGLVFAPTVHSAGVLADALRDEGFRVALVHGMTPAPERARIIADYVAGRIQILSNCGVFTEGTDLPMCSCVVIARPTKSNGLYIQMAGRAFRLFEGKADGLILDVVGATVRHSLVARVELFGEAEAAEIEQDELTAPEDADELSLALSDPLDGPDDAAGDFVEYADGDIVSDIVDLFHGSESDWLCTYAGVWFLPAGNRLIAILPSPERTSYDVVAMHRYTIGQSQWLTRYVPTLALAMAQAEDSVTPAERTVVRRARAWRAKAPSQAQRTYAQQFGITIERGMLSGEVSNAISVAQGSGRIDPYLPAYVPRS